MAIELEENPVEKKYRDDLLAQTGINYEPRFEPITEAPKALDAERMVLASLLEMPDDLLPINLTIDDFYSTAHKKIFSAIQHAHKNKIPVEFLSVKTILAQMGFTDLDIPAELDKLAFDSATSANLDFYVQRLREKANLRKILNGSYALQNKISAGVPVDELVEKLDALKMSISCTPSNIWKVEDLSPESLFISEPGPVKMLVPEAIPQGVVGVLFAEGGATKSIASLRLAVDLAVAEGETISCKWLDRFIIDKSARTLYLHLEDEEEDLQRRLWVIRENISFCGFSTPSMEEITDRINKNLFILRRESVFSDSGETFIDGAGNPGKKFDRLLTLCDQVGPQLIVIDTRTKASRADENKTDVAAAELEAWTRLRDKTGATILLNAHTNKMARTPGIGDQGANSLRGAGSYADNSRLLIGFRAASNGGDEGRLIEVTNPKNTKMKAFEKFVVSFEYPNYVLCKEGAQKGKTAIAREQVLDLVATKSAWSYGDLRAAIMEKTGVKVRSAEEKIKDLLALGKVLKNDNGTYSMSQKTVESPAYFHE